MAITIGTIAFQRTFGGWSLGTPATVNVDAGSATNRLMLGFMIHHERTIVELKYNNLALTIIGSVANGLSKITAGYLIAPATGSHELFCSLDANSAYALVGVPLDGVNQTTPVTGLQTGTGTGSPFSVAAVASAVGDLVFDAICASYTTTAGVATPGADQTERYQAAAEDNPFGVSTQPGAASVTMGWTATSVAGAAYSILAFNVQSASVTPSPGVESWLPQAPTIVLPRLGMTPSGSSPGYRRP